MAGALATAFAFAAPRRPVAQGANMTVQGPFRTLDALRASLVETGVSALDQQMLVDLLLGGLRKQPAGE